MMSSDNGTSSSPVPPIPTDGDASDHSYLFMKVEKRGSFRTSWTARDFAVDLRTRHVYMSGKESSFNTPWKHKAKMYAITSLTIMEDMPYRHSAFDPHELLAFTIECAERDLSKQDPIFTRGSTALAVYEEGTLQPTVCKTPRVRRKNGVLPSEGDDFDTSRVTWELRCRSYDEFAKVFFPLRELLEVDGFRSAFHCGLPPVDPRNSLRFVTLPVHLWRAFKPIVRAAMYTCIHVNVIGCDHSGKIGVCQPHAYLCITDDGVMIIDEKGSACRWVSARFISGVYHSTQCESPYIAILAEGRKPDTICYLTPAFKTENVKGGTAKKITDSVPPQEPSSAAAEVINALTVLKSTMDPSVTQEGGPELYVEEVVSPDIEVSHFIDGFEVMYSRVFKWQAQAGDDDSAPRLRSKVSIAKQLKLLPPKRSGVTLREVFIPFYSQHVEHDTTPMDKLAGVTKDTPADEFAPEMPIRRTSKILEFYIPQASA